MKLIGEEHGETLIIEDIGIFKHEDSLFTPYYIYQRGNGFGHQGKYLFGVVLYASLNAFTAEDYWVLTSRDLRELADKLDELNTEVEDDGRR